MKFTFKDSFNSQTGVVDLGDEGVVSNEKREDGNYINITVPYSGKSWESIRGASHFLSEQGDKVRIKLITISQGSLCVTGFEVSPEL